ncbi:hypothetical protein J0A68_02025 [Algoriphagus sp. H41]|uniref:Uncharacterized protein n=1 Tax=Algoriphagus oliviformis TaxID=2811231 RepID=A0ABS3C0N8_9BACT|nr:hypothetical protein [Algoriphagus oliviformis]MBN7809716.1 hypothetical protein [Algoriphagus oliviformis]
MMTLKNYLLFGLLIWAAFSCTSGQADKKMEKLPYFNLSGFLDLELAKLDGTKVTKISEVNGEESNSEKAYSLQEWKEEFEAFYSADINSPALAASYSTETEGEYLIHRLLPEAKGKVKEIKIKYLKEYPNSISVRMTEKNLFFSSSTLAEFYMNLATEKIDHYSIETSQKVWFLEPTHIKISGAVK